MSSAAPAPVRPADDTYLHAHGRRAAPRHGEFSAFWPILVFFLAWLAWAVFQGYQLHAEARNLQTLKSGQQTQIEQAQRVRQTLDALASETQKLADTGNANAKLVIEELRKRGITVNRPGSDAAPAK